MGRKVTRCVRYLEESNSQDRCTRLNYIISVHNDDRKVVSTVFVIQDIDIFNYNT